MFCRLHHNTANEQSHWPESTNAIMQHKPLHCELRLWRKKNELDATVCGFVILQLLHRTKEAFTVYTDTWRGRKRFLKKEIIKDIIKEWDRQ